MRKDIQFGASSRVSFEPRSDLLAWDGPRGRPLADVVAATSAALTEPIEFPPLRKAIVPGDRIVLALEPDVPQAPAIVAAVVEAVLQGGVAAEDITILCAAGDLAANSGDPRAGLPGAYQNEVRLAVHHPAARGDLSYLAVDEHDLPIYMSRHLLDADVIVSVGCVRLDAALGYGGVRATLYPTFADQDAQERCLVVPRNPRGKPAHSGRSARRPAAKSPRSKSQNGEVSQHDAEHVAWLLGAMFTVQVVPGAGDEVLAVLAGKLEAVQRRGQQLCRDAWTFRVPTRASLVVAAIDGGAEQQTWENVGRALAAAERVVDDNGAIALCTELTRGPAGAVKVAAEAEVEESGHGNVRTNKAHRSPVADQWAQALRRGRLYLLSQLDEEKVENLGAAHISSPDEVGRLISRADSCVVLESAQHVLPTAVND
jgi:nickel-dependent lactate racemase